MEKTQASPPASMFLRAARAVVCAFLIWGILAGLAFAIWALFATNDDAPVDYPFAISEYQGYARFGWITQAEADQHIAAARDEYLNWAWSAARQPLVYSVVTVPFIALLISRAIRRRAVHQSRPT